MNLLVHGDALSLGTYVQEGAADLAYLDPPFAVGVAFGARTRPNEVRALHRTDSGPVAYDDRWESLDAYFAWLSPRIELAFTRLSSQGTLWLHLDQRAVHDAKVMCDKLFGRRSFVGEIIWVPGNGSKARRGPGICHQTLLIYARSTNFVWNHHDPMLRAPYASTSLSMHFKNKDEDGRAYRERYISGKVYRYYADEGRAIGSVWDDCSAMVANTPLPGTNRETTGYPTQKPRKLLERIIRAATHPEGLVVDPFCGSGTTLDAAASLGRRFVGCDIGSLAIQTCAKRLHGRGIPFTQKVTSKSHPHERSSSPCRSSSSPSEEQ